MEKLFDGEFRLMEVLWETGPVNSTRLAALCREKLGWSKKTRNLKLVAIQSFYKLSSNHYISLMFYYLEPQNILKKNNF